MKYACGVILYNPDKDVKKRLEGYASIFDQLIVYDNSSKSNEALVENISNTVYLHTGSNDGMSIALNEIYRYVIKNHFDILLTMDQDTVYPIAEIEKMKKYIEACNDKNAAVYSANYAKLYESNQGKKVGKLNIPRTENKDILFSMTSGSFMNVKYLPSVLPLDDWFIGFVDYDVCAAIKTKNPSAKIIRYGNSVMYQEVGRIVKDHWINKMLHVVHQSDIRYYYMIRNIYWFIDKYSMNSEYISLAKRQMVRILFNILFEDRRIDKIRYCVKGKIDYGKGKTGKYGIKE